MDIYITNHARIRYLERVKDFPKEKIDACQGKSDADKIQTIQDFNIIDVKKIDNEILGRNPERVRHNLDTIHNCYYPLKSHVLKVTRGRVVTVLPKGSTLFRRKIREKGMVRGVEAYRHMLATQDNLSSFGPTSI